MSKNTDYSPIAGEDTNNKNIKIQNNMYLVYLGDLEIKIPKNPINDENAIKLRDILVQELVNVIKEPNEKYTKSSGRKDLLHRFY